MESKEKISQNTMHVILEAADNFEKAFMVYPEYAKLQEAEIIHTGNLANCLGFAEGWEAHRKGLNISKKRKNPQLEPLIKDYSEISDELEDLQKKANQKLEKLYNDASKYICSLKESLPSDIKNLSLWRFSKIFESLEFCSDGTAILNFTDYSGLTFSLPNSYSANADIIKKLNCLFSNWQDFTDILNIAICQELETKTSKKREQLKNYNNIINLEISK